LRSSAIEREREKERKRERERERERCIVGSMLVAEHTEPEESGAVPNDT
jgi:hypothetical protein